jgi:hypothetical protein
MPISWASGEHLKPLSSSNSTRRRTSSAARARRIPGSKIANGPLSSRKCGAIGRHVAKVPGKHSKIRSVTGGIKCAVGALPDAPPLRSFGMNNWGWQMPAPLAEKPTEVLPPGVPQISSPSDMLIMAALPLGGHSAKVTFSPWDFRAMLSYAYARRRWRQERTHSRIRGVFCLIPDQLVARLAPTAC